jgi:hypothetical protein
MSEVKKLDFIGGVLYGAVPEERIQKTVWDAAKRLDEQCAGERKMAHKIAEEAQKSTRVVKVCALFALLNYDSALKAQLRDLGEKKAYNFYTGLRDDVNRWLRDDCCSEMDFVEMLRTLYRNA